MKAAYRRSGLSVISAFRTVMPLKLVVNVDRRRGTHLSKPVQLIDDAMDRWQCDWSNSTKVRHPLTHTEHRRLDQLETRLGDTVANRY